MRIGILLPSIYASVQKYGDMIFAPRDLAVLMADSFTDRGHKVVLFASDDINTKAKVVGGDWNLFPGKLFIEKLKRVSSEERGKWGTFYNLKREYEVDLTMKAFRYASENLDILHIYHDDYSHYFNEITNVPCLYTLHDPMPPEKSLENWRLMKFKNHNYISISDFHRGGYDLNFIQTIYHGLNLKNYIYNENPNEYFSFIGRVVKEKGVDIALDIAEAFKTDIKLAYNNDKIEKEPYYKQEIKPRLSKMNGEEVGFLTGKPKSDFYANSKLLLFPIQWEEPFGLVMIEAMSCGTPVLAFAKGSVPEIVKDGETGFIVNSSERNKRGDWVIKKIGIEGMIEAVKTLNSMSKDQYIQMRRNCRTHIENKFSVEKMIEAYEKVYTKVITDFKDRNR